MVRREDITPGGFMKRQIDIKKTKQVRIDSVIHKLLKMESARSGQSIRSLVEGAVADLVGVKNIDG